MKILIINGSFDKNGCADFGVEYFVNELKKYNIEADVFVLKDEVKNEPDFLKVIDKSALELTERMKDADGLMIAGQEQNGVINGECNMLMNRFFEVCPNKHLQFKAASPFIVLRRDGGSSAHNLIAMNFLFHHMNFLPASYMREMHGENVEECKRDVEALESLESLAQTFDWYFTLRRLAKEDGIEEPVHDDPVYTNYIRPESEY